VVLSIRGGGMSAWYGLPDFHTGCFALFVRFPFCWDCQVCAVAVKVGVGLAYRGKTERQTKGGRSSLVFLTADNCIWGGCPASAYWGY
jgi:hypothetical protein